MAQPSRAPLAYFLRPRRTPGILGGNRPSEIGNSARYEHWDLLTFLSIAAKFQVDFSEETFRLGLRSLGRGATSNVVETSLSKDHGLAFKVPTASAASFGAENTEKAEVKQLKILIHELVALESLRSNPFVVDLLGITFHVNVEFNQVLPVMLTEASTHGTLTRLFLSAKGSTLTTAQRLKLCGNVAQACYGMHMLGIVHGDIKTDNVLVFEDGGGNLTAKVIDFGYSCFGTSQSDMVTVPRTKGWYAPEHQPGKPVKWADAQKMDLFSFGLLVCRLMLWEELISTAITEGLLLPKEGQDINANVDSMIDELKATRKLLDLIAFVMDASSNISGAEKECLRKILFLTLDPDPTLRAAGFAEIIPIMDPTLKPNPHRFQPVQIDKLCEEVVEFGHILSDLDSADYMVRRRLYQDLKRRVVSHNGCPCFKPCAKQLWLCCEIGLGTKRNRQAAAQWHSQCTDTTWDTQEYFELINKQYYDAGNAARDDRLSTLIGYVTSSATVSMSKYREGGRLEEAEAICRQDLEARKQSIGPQSRAYLAQLMLLSAILTEAEDAPGSLHAVEEAVQMYTNAYGKEDLGAMGARSYHANILFHFGLFEEAQNVQLDLLQLKQSKFGSKHRTTQTSRVMLVAIHHFQGRSEECLSEARTLLQEQAMHLEDTHPDVLNTRFWICHAKLALEDNIVDLLKDTRRLVQDYEAVAIAEDEGALLAKELLARVLLAVAKPDPSAPVTEEYLDECLEILVDQVLNRMEDSHEVFEDTDSEESTPLSDQDLSMEDADEPGSPSDSDSDTKSGSGGPFLEGVNFTTLLMAYTTFICALGFKFDFPNIRRSIPVITSEDFQGHFIENHLDIVRLGRVLPLIAKLESLADSGIADGDEVNQILWGLSHRWLLT
ncbi:hypothetical protein OQA88_7208 [Cercophora sp. LCS_1]